MARDTSEVSYNPELSSDLDWVRFLSWDTDEASPVLDDREIEALLVEEKNKYLAAARAGEIIMSRMRGVSEKVVDDYKLKFSAEGPYPKHIAKVRARGMNLALSSVDGNPLMVNM